jgi:hypothetical protein
MASLKSVRDIIAAATQGWWHITLGSGMHVCTAIYSEGEGGKNTFICDCLPDNALKTAEKNHAPNLHYIQAFNPEHVRLMEDVVRAANHLAVVNIPFHAEDGTEYNYSNRADMERLHEARLALRAYREQEGLDL